jgi:hypothetical protein
MRAFGCASLALVLSACSHGTRVEPTPREPHASAITPPSPPAKVKIMVRTSPSKVFVHWGKKNLGLTPLNFERPRDSGPIDLVLRLQGYFPVRTRAYTVKNDIVSVKMVKLENRMTIFGAKAELPPDGGTPPDPALDPNSLVKPPAAGTPPGAPTPTPITQ